jgi:hypothetical protein
VACNNCGEQHDTDKCPSLEYWPELDEILTRLFAVIDKVAVVASGKQER